MLNNGSMNAARSQVAHGRADFAEVDTGPTPISGVDHAKDRLAQLGGLLGEIELTAEQQINRLSGAVPMCDEARTGEMYRSGTLGELHAAIDGLFATAQRIRAHTARLTEI